MSDAVARSYPLPDDPTLAKVAVALRDAGHWAQLYDDRWRLVYVTDELRRTFGGGELADFAIGEHQFGVAQMTASRRFRLGANTDELLRRNFESARDLVLADTPGGLDELRALVDPVLQDLVETAIPSSSEVAAAEISGSGLFGPTGVWALYMRVRDATGRLAGTIGIFKPAVGMATLAAMTADADSGHVQRMQLVARPARRPAAILFADLEGSSALARRLSTAAYFALSRRLVRAADQCVVDAGGLIGRHLGDGVVAFFLGETAGSESAAARACVQAMQELRASVERVALRSDLRAADVILRFGLHWGSTLYVGNITTRGRSEVSALGDEVNEAARIEACASGGRALASKDLIERLDAADAEALGIVPDRLAYTTLGDLHTATDKSRRDAPAIPVCEL